MSTPPSLNIAMTSAGDMYIEGSSMFMLPEVSMNGVGRVDGLLGPGRVYC